MNKRLLALTLLTSAITANAQEWTQWRGPARDGSVSAKNTPAKWPETFQRTWRVEIGEGYSSPVVAGGRVFVHGRRDPATWAMPVLLGSNVLVRDATGVMLLTGK